MRQGGVDKFAPVSGGDGALDCQAAEAAFDVVSLFSKRPVMFDLDAGVLSAWDDGPDVAACEVGSDGVGVNMLVS